MIGYQFFLQKVLTATAVTLTVGFGSISGAIAQSFTGAGATFPEPLYRRYFREYQQETTDVKLKYSAIGSGGGIRRFLNQSVDFGASNVIPTPVERNSMKRGLLMVPTAGGSLAVVYNLQGITTDVKLSRDTLGKIFSGQISNWKQVNSRLPNRKIQVVVHSGTSGTSFIFTKYLNEITNGRIRPSRKPNWGFKVFSSVPGNGPVASEVKRIDGAIGYVPASYAKQLNLPMARLENQAGRYVKPTVDQANKALANVQFNDDFTIENIDDPEEGYPIVGITWLFVYEKYPKPELAQGVKDLINWILTEGQDLNEDLQYTRIPEDVANRAIEAVNNNIRVVP
ncbi:MAG: phosphate ABC transporter substrate-binding protein PstS [Moorea sp. SIO3C2]|nr:phosphate ABC transporter substrate-binding protein PstS [Moorena sp. SIO3C2]